MTSHKAYLSRYYILTVESLLVTIQSLTWVTFSPIADDAKEWYGFTDIDLTLFPTYSPICFMIFFIPFIWFLQKFGLKIIGLSSAWIMAVGCIIRCFVPYVPDASKWIWLMHIGSILIGYVNIPIMVLPPKISSVWFKPRERTFATAVAITAQNLGVVFGFIFNPLITQLYGIRTMLIVHAELSVFVALLFTIYFPSGPPSPPSASAEEERINILFSFKKLITNPSFILLLISCGVFIGVNFGFQSVLTIILNPSLGFNDKVIVQSVEEFFYSSSWMGTVSNVIFLITGPLVGLLANIFPTKFKIMLIIFVILSLVFSIWFSFAIYGWGSSNPVYFFISYCLCCTFTSTAIPIYYEAAVECTYPIGEGTSSGILSLSINIGNLIFAIIGMAGVFSDEHPERAKIMSLVTAGSALVAIICLFFYREQYRRLTADTNISHRSIPEEISDIEILTSDEEMSTDEEVLSDVVSRPIPLKDEEMLTNENHHRDTDGNAAIEQYQTSSM